MWETSPPVEYTVRQSKSEFCLPERHIMLLVDSEEDPLGHLVLDSAKTKSATIVSMCRFQYSILIGLLLG